MTYYNISLNDYSSKSLNNILYGVAQINLYFNKRIILIYYYRINISYRIFLSL